MKPISTHRTLSALLATVLATFAVLPSPAVASTPDSTEEEALDAIHDLDPTGLDPVELTVDDGAFVSDQDGGVQVEIPLEAGAPMTMTTDVGEVEISIPGTGSTDATLVDDSSAVFDAGSGIEVGGASSGRWSPSGLHY